MKKKERFDLYKEFYYKEEERQNEIINSLTIPIGIISALIVSIFYLITSFEYKLNIALDILFIFFAVINSMLLFFAIYYLIKTISNFHNGYGFKYLANVSELEMYYQDLKKFYLNNNDNKNKSKKEFKKYILKELVSVVSENQQNNDRRSDFRYKCHGILSYVTIGLTINLILFAYNYYEQKKQIESVILNDKTHCFSSENIKFIDSLVSIKINNMADNSNNPKPTPPSSRTIKTIKDSPSTPPNSTKNKK